MCLTFSHSYSRRYKTQKYWEDLSSPKRSHVSAEPTTLGTLEGIQDALCGTLGDFLEKEDFLELQKVSHGLHNFSSSPLALQTAASDKETIHEELSNAMFSIMRKTTASCKSDCVYSNVENRGRLIVKSTEKFLNNFNSITQIFIDKMRENAKNEALTSGGYGALIETYYLEGRIDEEDSLAYLAFGDVFFKGTGDFSDSIHLLDMLQDYVNYKNIIPLVKYGQELLTDDMKGEENIEVLSALARKYNGQQQLTRKYRAHVNKILSSDAINLAEVLLANAPTSQLKPSVAYFEGATSKSVKIYIFKILLSLDIENIDTFFATVESNFESLLTEKYILSALDKISSDISAPSL